MLYAFQNTTRMFVKKKNFNQFSSETIAINCTYVDFRNVVKEK